VSDLPITSERTEPAPAPLVTKAKLSPVGFALILVLMVAGYIVLVKAPEPVSQPLKLTDPYGPLTDINTMAPEVNSITAEQKGTRG
jgi:hypothetical protein